jgi:hypothetical protein
MEVAKLLNQNIFLEEERMTLEQEGLQWYEVERFLNVKYRGHSDKGYLSAIII